jgi:hypothetical protein
MLKPYGGLEDLASDLGTRHLVNTAGATDLATTGGGMGDEGAVFVRRGFRKDFSGFHHQKQGDLW